MKSSRHVAALIAVLAIGIGVFLSFGNPWPTPTPAPQVGYTLLDGTQGDTAELRGKVVLMNFWATSCTICVAEMPKLAATHEKFHARGLETIAVAMQYDPPVAVVRYAAARRLPFGVAIDNTGAIAKGFGEIDGTPTTVLINRRGEIVRRYVGEPDFAALERTLDRLLAEG